MSKLKQSRVKLNLEFHGADFFGWQIQSEGTNTVQGVLNKCLAIIFKEPVKTIGSGRTDAKVHSLDHHIIFTPPFNIELSSLVKGLNSHLPDSIRVKGAEHATDELNITKDAKLREYRYLFTNNAEASAFQAELMSNISYELDFAVMREALGAFVGEYDFTDFHTKGSEPRTTVRTIFEADLSYIETNTHGIFPDHYCIRLTGEGFLKQMVRLIVGAVWKVGRGKLTIAEVKSALNNPAGKHLAPVAPAHGLYKYKVNY